MIKQRSGLVALAGASLLVASSVATTVAQEPLSAVLIGNQRFGDKGPMDAFAAGLDTCASEYGFEIQKLESIEPAGYEDDIRAIAAEGYDLVLTTFPPMQDATRTVSKEFPDVKFRAIYQFLNMPGDTDVLANVESTEYQGQHATYILGALAGKLTKSGKLGGISGDADPSVSAALNGWVAGALYANPDITFEWSPVAGDNPYDNPAGGKELGLAMISRGVDIIQTQAAASQLGVIDASKENGTLVSGDVANNADLYPEGFFTYHALDFGNDVVLACKSLVEGTWTGGTHLVLDLASGTYRIPWDVTEAWAAVQTFTDADTVTEAIAFAKDVETKVVSGEIVVENNPNAPAAIGQ